MNCKAKNAYDPTKSSTYSAVPSGQQTSFQIMYGSGTYKNILTRLVLQKYSHFDKAL